MSFSISFCAFYSSFLFFMLLVTFVVFSGFLNSLVIESLEFLSYIHKYVPFPLHIVPAFSEMVRRPLVVITTNY